MNGLHMECSQIAMGLAPVADFAAADPVYSDVISMKLHGRLRFLVVWGVGTTGTIKFTVEACDDVVPTNVAAVPFHYRITAAGAVPGAIIRTTAADGVTNVAGSDQIIEIELIAAELSASGYSYARLKMDEVVNSPILGGILVELLDPIHHGPATSSVVV